MLSSNETRVSAQGRVTNITDLREKATLLLSDDTPFFDQVKAQSKFTRIDKQSSEKVYGVNFGTLNAWKNGNIKTGINSSSLEAMASKINKIYRHSEEQASKCYPADLAFMIKSNKYEFGELLGMQWRDTRRILDQRLYAKSMATTLLTMPSKHTGVMNHIKGLCIAWHMTPTRVNGKEEYRLIRSLLDICDPVIHGDEKSVYRCRWRLPYVKKNKHNNQLRYYHYLGSVAYTQQNETYTWLFEPKNPEAVEGSPDFPYFLTQETECSAPLQFGFYVSKSQDKLIYTSKIGICKINQEHVATIDNTSNGLIKYRGFINDIVDNGVFMDIKSARQQACCENEKRLLDTFRPACNVL